MTNEEAIKNLKKGCTYEYEGSAEEFCKAYDMAIEALEKQIPKKPKTMLGYFHICPNCNSGNKELDPKKRTRILIPRQDNYCNLCGQHVLWEGVKE